MTGRLYLITLAAAAVLISACAVVGAWGMLAKQQPVVVNAMFALSVPFAAITWFTLRGETRQSPETLRRAVWLILGVAVLLRFTLLFMPPVSTDLYRYVWDGRVQAAGINPYRYVPADPVLASLRDNAIYPNINRADYAHTIYPPTAQILFRAVAAVGGGVTTLKLVIVLLEGFTMWMVLALLGARGLPQTRVLLYAWHPLPLFEFSGSGHIDAAAIAFMMLALVAAERGKQAGAGALLALATLAKFFPIVIAPTLYRRWGWRAPVMAAVVCITLYLPFLSLGWGVFGFLSGYANEEDLVRGGGFFLLAMIDGQVDLPSWAAAAYLGAGLSILGAGALWAVFRSNRDRVALGTALFLLTAATVIMSPHLDWYFTWVIPLLCFRPVWSIVYLTCAAPLLYYQVFSPDDLTYTEVLYFPFFALLVIEGIIRLVRQYREHPIHVRFA